MIVFFHLCAAPSGIHDDKIRVRSLERSNVSSRESTSGLCISSVRMERTATTLAFGPQDFVAIPRECAFSGSVGFGIQALHYAAFQDCRRPDRRGILKLCCGAPRKPGPARAFKHGHRKSETSG